METIKNVSFVITQSADSTMDMNTELDMNSKSSLAEEKHKDVSPTQFSKKLRSISTIDEDEDGDGDGDVDQVKDIYEAVPDEQQLDDSDALFRRSSSDDGVEGVDRYTLLQNIQQWDDLSEDDAYLLQGELTDCESVGPDEGYLAPEYQNATEMPSPKPEQLGASSAYGMLHPIESALSTLQTETTAQDSKDHSRYSSIHRALAAGGPNDIVDYNAKVDDFSNLGRTYSLHQFARVTSLVGDYTSGGPNTVNQKLRHSRRMFRALSARPGQKSDFKNPQKCLECKFGSMRRTWTFLDLTLEDEDEIGADADTDEPEAVFGVVRSKTFAVDYRREHHIMTTR